MLARLLHHLASIECTIFEAEDSLHFRSQGGTLDFSSGLGALKAAGLYEEFLRLSRFDGAALGVCDKHAKFYMRVGATKAGNPE